VAPATAPVGEVAALGSPTRTVTKNADGTTTVKVTPTKSRFKDPAGVWRDLDLTLVPQPDGSLGAKAGDGSIARVAKATAGGAGLVSAPTVAGPIVLAHPDTAPGLAPRLAGAAATFGKAAAGRDVQVQLRPDGFEESLLLASATALTVPGGAAAAGSYTETFTLPAGVSARQAKAGVEFVDKTGAVIASYGGGSAQDSKVDPRSGDPASSPVTTTLVGQAGVVATVHVAADPAWLADPARVFPITVDPTFAADTGSEGAGGFDTYTYSPNPTTAEGSFDTDPVLKVGSFDGGASRARAYLVFTLNGFQNTQVPVQSAQLSLFNTYSYGCDSGGQSIYAQAAGGPFSRGGTTWNNQPNGDGGSPNIGSPPFAHGHDGSCGPDWVRWDIGAQAQRWSNGAANLGLTLTSSDETNSYGWRKFANGASGATAPTLVITYGTNNCTYYPQTGHSVCGAIRDHYNALGGPNGFLGYPTSDEITNPDGVGKRNTFQNGGDYIYWSPATGAAEIGGAIVAHWGNYGYETGPLGYPTSDELGTPNGAGRYNVFQNVGDHIYWSPATGAQEIGGSIFTHWGDFGFEAGRLGFPTTDETGSPDGVGRFNHFQGSNGSIYFSPASGTHELEGAIYNRWGQTGYEDGPLGYPTTDERAASTEYNGTQDRQNDFTHGSIYFNWQNAVSNVQLNPQLLTGPESFYSQDATALTDRVSASVNRGTGNLGLSVAGLSAPGVNGNTGAGITYNSLFLAPGSPYPGSHSFGPPSGWRSSFTPDVGIVTGLGYADVVLGSGAVWRFNGTTTFTPPPGVNANLTHNGDGTWTLAMHDSSSITTFDSGGALTGVSDRNNNVTAYTPTTITGTRGAGDGRVVQETYNGPGGKLSQLCQSTVAANCTATATRSATTLVVSYAYDANNNLVSVTDPSGKVTSFGYDTNNTDVGMRQNLTSMTDPNGVVTRFGYDSIHRVTSITRDVGGVNAQTVYDYITVDGHTRVADPTHPRGSGVFTDYTHAPNGAITNAVDPKGNQTSTMWTSNNQVASTLNALGGTTTLNYTQPQGAAPNPNTSQGESVSGMNTPMGSTWGTTYANGAGAANFLPTTGVDPSSNTTTFGYNTPGNQVSSNNAMAATALVTYNPDGTVATSTDPNNAPKGVATPMASTTYRYDGGHNLTSITPPASGDDTMAVRTLTYDGFGRTATVTTGAVTTTYGYDLNGRITAEAHTGGAPTISRSFDAAGNVLTSTDGGGTVTTTYTKTNQVASSARAGASPTNTSYTYDPAGNVLTLVDGRGTTRYHYDKAQKVDQVTESGGNIDIFGYNSASHVVDSYYGTSGTNGAAATYDSSGNTLQPPAGFAVHQQGLLDTAGRLRETIAYRASADTPGNRVMDLSYCYSPQVLGQGCPTASGSHDTNKRQYSTDNLTGGVTTYAYDKGGRLHSAVTAGGPNPGTFAYCYDDSGNRTYETNTLVDCSLVGVGSGKTIAPTHTYNTVNQLTSDNAGYDANGNQTTPTPLTPTSYNSLDQYTADGSNTYGGSTNNERLTTNGTTVANGITGIHSTKTGNAAATYYERTPSGGLIAERGAGGEYYYVTDGNGSIVALVDTTGTVQATYSYDAAGKTTTIGGPNPAIAGGNPFRYAGGYTDTTSGLIKFGARYYNPALGRWTQLDSLNSLLDFTNGNRYAYAGDDPINNSDPSGKAPYGTCGGAFSPTLGRYTGNGNNIDFRLTGQGLDQYLGQTGIGTVYVSLNDDNGSTSLGEFNATGQAGANIPITASYGQPGLFETKDPLSVSVELTDTNNTQTLCADTYNVEQLVEG